MTSPAIGSDTIYVGTYDNHLNALNLDGSLKWSYETGGSVSSSPALGSDCTIYVGSNDNYLYALNQDGSLKWSYETGGYVRSSPAIGNNGTIYIGSKDNNLYAFNGNSSGLAETLWPSFQEDVRNSGHFGDLVSDLYY